LGYGIAGRDEASLRSCGYGLNPTASLWSICMTSGSSRGPFTGRVVRSAAGAPKGRQTARFEELRCDRWFKGSSVHWNLVRLSLFDDDWFCSCTQLARLTHSCPSSTCSMHDVPCLPSSVLKDIEIAIPTYESNADWSPRYQTRSPTHHHERSHQRVRSITTSFIRNRACKGHDRFEPSFIF